jgi:uncharacterized membrane protein YdcZ (DUF606 family)
MTKAIDLIGTFFSTRDNTTVLKIIGTLLTVGAVIAQSWETLQPILLQLQGAIQR